jgi:hypothetical protein
VVGVSGSRYGLCTFLPYSFLPFFTLDEETDDVAKVENVGRVPIVHVVDKALRVVGEEGRKEGR